MLGAIIGDIVGSRFEFTAPPQRKDFELFTPDCSFTDDTICTVAVADAILHGRTYRDALLDWCRRYPDPMGGYGHMFYHWINSDDPQPTDSFGNGAAMRVSPVGWMFDDFNQVLEQARLTAIPSHNHPEGVKGAQCVAALIYWLRTTRVTKHDMLKAVTRRFRYEIMPLKDIYKIGSEGHFDGTCQETVPMAVRCFNEANDFEDTIRTTILAGGDTDTKADIAGAIAEAYYEIPAEMADRAMEYLPAEMLDILNEFYETVENNIRN